MFAIVGNYMIAISAIVGKSIHSLMTYCLMKSL